MPDVRQCEQGVHMVCLARQPMGKLECAPLRTTAEAVEHARDGVEGHARGVVFVEETARLDLTTLVASWGASALALEVMLREPCGLELGEEATYDPGVTTLGFRV
jgi:hypothetical protein